MSAFRNPNGTYDGAAMLSAASGISRDEIMWTFERLKHLMHVEGKSKDEAKAIVADEGRSKPWEAG